MDMKIYVCWSAGGPNLHPCHKAYQALVDAGYNPEVVRVRGKDGLPRILQTKGRKEVFELTGSYAVPVLTLDNGTVIKDSKVIADWAKSNPAT